MGTRFLATPEAAIDPAYTEMIVGGAAQDVMITSELTGTPATFLWRSIRQAGLSPETLIAAAEACPGEFPQPWKDIWSTGQGIGSIKQVAAMQEVVRELAGQFNEAVQDFSATARAWVTSRTSF